MKMKMLTGQNGSVVFFCAEPDGDKQATVAMEMPPWFDEQTFLERAKSAFSSLADLVAKGKPDAA